MTGPAGLAAKRAAAAARTADKGSVQPVMIHLYGKHQDPSFQMLKMAAEYLASERECVEATVEGFFETQYEQHLRHAVCKFGGSFTQSKPCMPLIYVETEDQILYFANEKMFLEWACRRYKYEDNTNLILYKRIGNKAVKMIKEKTCRSYCAISISIGDEQKETVQLELFDEESPSLALNFLKLLAKPKFDGHQVHRVKAGCWVQAGDLVDGSGMNSEAADGELMRHESFRIQHDRPGLLGMCSHGKDSVGSQFYVTLREMPFLDGKFCVIGRVISGMRAILRISKLATKNERPLQEVKIFAEPSFTAPGAHQPK